MSNVNTDIFKHTSNIQLYSHTTFIKFQLYVLKERFTLTFFRRIIINKKIYVALNDTTIEENVLPKWRSDHNFRNFLHLQIDWFSNKREFHSRTKGTTQPLKKTATWHAVTFSHKYTMGWLKIAWPEICHVKRYYLRSIIYKRSTIIM